MLAIKFNYRSQGSDMFSARNIVARHQLLLSNATTAFALAVMLLAVLGGTDSAYAGEAKASAGHDAVIKDVLVVHQNGNVLGKTDLYLSDNACRLVGRNGDIIMASKAPDWDIIVFAKQRNSAIRISAAQGKKSS